MGKEIVPILNKIHECEEGARIVVVTCRSDRETPQFVEGRLGGVVPSPNSPDTLQLYVNSQLLSHIFQFAGTAEGIDSIVRVNEDGDVDVVYHNSNVSIPYEAARDMRWTQDNKREMRQRLGLEE